MNDDKDIFEKAFGKEPLKAYDITFAQVSCGWRSAVVQWSAKGIGFGELAIIIGDDNVIYADTEHMGKKFCDAVMEKLYENMEKNFEKYPRKDYGDSRFTVDFIKNLYNKVDWEFSLG